jgi:hypothetical protein
VGAAAERTAYDIEELFAPLWSDTKPNYHRRYEHTKDDTETEESEALFSSLF